MINKKVRVRFAPSPTGPLHIGGVRTALFNYLFAKKHKGDFLLRIEDTDQTRFVPGAEEYIKESLAWCGIKIDEGINEGGNFGPYKQSERKDIYIKYATKLIESGNAYYAFDTAEELDFLRKESEQNKDVFTYNTKTRNNLNNSLNLGANKTKELINAGKPYVIRFKMPENYELTMNDIIRKEVRVNTNTLDDKVLFKSDGLPTYHLANVVDDKLMKISHVIRGEEWLPSLPLHILLYKALGWENNIPEFAHLPLILKPVGNGKLSKRDGDKMGFPVFPLLWKSEKGEIASGYREDGYFPEAFVNLLALLGWNPGTEQELFTLDELIEQFSLERVIKSGSKFDPKKAEWFNHQYLLKKSDEEVANLYMPILKEKGIEPDFTILKNIVSMVKDRVNFIKDIWEHTHFFFETPTEYDAKVVKKRWKENTPALMTDIIEIIKNTSNYKAKIIKQAVSEYIEKNELNFGAIMNALRLSIVGASKGPDLFDIIEIIGKEETVKRINNAILNIK